MAQFARIGKPVNVNMAKIWVGHTETWPIIACITVAIGWTGYNMGRAYFCNPDVVTSRAQREEPIKDDTILRTKGSEWLASHNKHVPADPSKLTLFGSYERKYQ